MSSGLAWREWDRSNWLRVNVGGNREREKSQKR